MVPSDQIKPITYLKNRTAELVSQVAETGQTVIVTQNGEARVAVMDVRLYDTWRRTLALLQLAAHAEADVAADRTVTQEEAFAQAHAALRAPEAGG